MSSQENYNEERLLYSVLGVHVGWCLLYCCRGCILSERTQTGGEAVQYGGIWKTRINSAGEMRRTNNTAFTYTPHKPVVNIGMENHTGLPGSKIYI